MELSDIQRQNTVERYLSGDLTVREAREFEKFCLEHPEVLAEMPIPVRLKARLARRPLEESETGIFPAIPSQATRTAAALAENRLKVEKPDDDDDVDDTPATRTPGSGVNRILAVALVLALAGLATYAWRANSLTKTTKTLQQAARAIQLQAPGSVREYRVLPTASGPPSSPTLALGWPNPPQLIELRIDVAASKFNTFQVTVDKVNEARVLQVRRVSRDSNKELRLGLNSSAFGPGTYMIQLEGYTWRGDLEPNGWIAVALQ